MAVDLPPNLQPTNAPIVRGPELPANPTSQTDAQRRNEARDGVNARNAEKNSSSKNG